jgi:hypothetical protein
MRGMLASFVVAVALLAVVSSEASAWAWTCRARLGSQLEHHRRQAVGAAAMRTDERVARLHHPVVWLIQTTGYGETEVLGKLKIRSRETAGGASVSISERLHPGGA